MSDPSAPHNDSADIRRDSGDPNRDRADLADLAPAQVDGDAIAENLGGDDDHDDASAARS